MALIFRSILEVQDAALANKASDLFRDWLRWKLRDPELELPEHGTVGHMPDQQEIRVSGGEDGGYAGFRGSLFEPRDTEQVRTTFTALACGDDAWSWVDLERWSDDPFSAGWVPRAPGMVGNVLRSAECRRGPTHLRADYVLLEGEAGALCARAVCSAEREVPVVVATPTREELEDDLGPAQERAEQLQRRLAGVAPVVLLGRGAVTAFSRAMLDVAPDMDVFGGSVRTYLPGAGGQGDWSRRHRFVPFHRLRGQPADRAARLVSLPVLRAACQQPPPEIWRNGVRALVGLEQRASDADLEELLELAEDEARQASDRADEETEARQRAEQNLELERETVAEVLGDSEDLRRRLRYLEEQIRARGEVLTLPTPEDDPPDFCSEVVERVEKSCDYIAIGPNVKDSAELLDEHAEPSWARKAWRSLQALDAYAAAKESGEVQGLNFITFCERGDHADVIPKSWVAPAESETTDQNPRFRDLRTFPVPYEVAVTGEIYMPAHIKIEKGGYPAPRIHFHDDTEGTTRKIHVGWFGPHRDNKSKS